MEALRVSVIATILVKRQIAMTIIRTAIIIKKQQQIVVAVRIATQARVKNTNQNMTMRKIITTTILLGMRGKILEQQMHNNTSINFIMITAIRNLTLVVAEILTTIILMTIRRRTLIHFSIIKITILQLIIIKMERFIVLTVRKVKENIKTNLGKCQNLSNQQAKEPILQIALLVT